MRKCLCKSFSSGFFTNENNYKQAWPPLWGHREVHTIEELAREHTGPTIYTMTESRCSNIQITSAITTSTVHDYQSNIPCIN